MEQGDIDRAIVTISKEILAELPAAEYKGKIRVIDNEADVEDAIAELRKAEIIGFDTETRPSFRKGLAYNVALIQLATENSCFLFRTNKIGFPKALIDLLADDSILKIGLSIKDDFHNIAKSCDINPKDFIDLQTFVKEYKIADMSLTKLYAIVFGERVSKGQRLTNWEAEELTEQQQAYAALDAYACIKIYNFLKSGKFDPMKSPYLTFPVEETAEEEEDNL